MKGRERREEGRERGERGEREEGGRREGEREPGGLAVCNRTQREVRTREGRGGTAGPQPVGRRQIQVHIGLLSISNSRSNSISAMTSSLTNCSDENRDRRGMRGLTVWRRTELLSSPLSRLPCGPTALPQDAILAA